MKSRLGTILFLLFTAVSIPLLVIALKQFNIFAPQAASVTPQFVTVANLTDTSVTITWTTPTYATISNLQWGDSTLLGTIATDSRDLRDKTTSSRTTHAVNLASLKPDTTYYYRIISGSTTYPAVTDLPLSFKTLSTPINSATTTVTLYGDAPSAKDANGVLIAYIQGPQGFLQFTPAAATLNTDGTWLLQFANARDNQGNYLSLDKNTKLVVVYFADAYGSVAVHTPNESPLTMAATTTISQSDIDQYLAATPQTTTGATPTPAVTTRQDVPLSRPGATVTTTPANNNGVTLSATEIFNTFSVPSLSNISDASASIMYLTREPEIATLQYGTTTALGSSRLDDNDVSVQTARHIHHFTLTGLSAATKYYFKATQDNSLRMFTTPARIAYPSGQTIIVGSINGGTGECVVRSQIKRGSIYSSIITTLPHGVTWTVNIAPVRTSSLDAFMVPGPSDTLITNGFCIATNGKVSYASTTSTVQTGVTSGITLQMVETN